MILLLRRVPQMDRDLHAGKWSKQIGRQLAGKTVVNCGFGRIGRWEAELLRPFGVCLRAVDPYAGIDSGVPVRSFEEALAIADVITIHVSGEEQILGRQEFDRIKRGAFPLNGSRGIVVDEAVNNLLRALFEDQ
ncbi:MAG TPA: NAD(P)-dependent oxidoreductase [Thermoanaerobaculia bacterium]|nr:NAD(P)-dependent oxidoreductase [Thermoanaerobaculia bacterium]